MNHRNPAQASVIQGIEDHGGSCFLGTLLSHLCDKFPLLEWEEAVALVDHMAFYGDLRLDYDPAAEGECVVSTWPETA